MKRGVLYALAAYLLWGVIPVYFKAVQTVAPTEVLAHRVLWSLALVALLLAILRYQSWTAALAKPAVLKTFVVSALLVSLNWLIYIWSVQTGHVVDASLGYFINPLVNVLIGAVVFKERLRRIQWTAVALAATGVAWLTWQAGQPPWIGLSLALTFSLYGLLRKTAALGALQGLAVETALLAPLALAWLGWLAANDASAFVSGITSSAETSPWTPALLLMAGPVTAVPLLLFAAAARRIPFSTLGLLQYTGPTLQLLLGVWLYGEPFGQGKAIGYALIWAALAVFSAELLLWSSRNRRDNTSKSVTGA